MLLLAFLAAVQALDLRSDAIFLVRSQDTPHDAAAGKRIQGQLAKWGVPPDNIILLHEKFTSRELLGKWTILPLLSSLWEEYRTREHLQWFIMLETSSEVVPNNLQDFLVGFDPAEAHYLGHGLKDDDHNIMAIIHHYATGDFYYPFLPAGLAISKELLKQAAEVISRESLPTDTHIDITHEVAKWMEKTVNVKLQSHTEVFCAEAAPGCAVHISPLVRLDHKLQFKDIVIAIKTTKSLHTTRVPIIKATYANPEIMPPDLEIVYLSDYEDPAVPSIDLTKEWGKQVNQKRGHCAKTDAILKHFEKHFPHKKFYVINDDDTLMNVDALLRVLNSYDHNKPYYIGERYGQGHTTWPGYDYVTMGGGVALSQAALKMRNSCAGCTCSAPDTPDDMMMGRWMQTLDIPLSHESGFHQAEPENYHPTRLKHDEAVSFHKFKQDYNRQTEQWELSQPLNIALYQQYLDGGETSFTPTRREEL